MLPGDIGLDDRPVRPLTIGVSIGSRYGSAGGTLGVFVWSKDGFGFLTTSSALAARNAKRGDEVFQPSARAAGTLTASNVIGRLEQWTSIREDQHSRIDAAMVALSPEIGTMGNIIPNNHPFSGKRIKRYLTTDKDLISKSVGKIGAGSGYTEGRVTALMNSLQIRGPEGSSHFDDLYEITSNGEEAFSSPGDSGALVFSTPELVPLGLIIASARVSDGVQVSYACRLSAIFDFFNVQLSD
jgi:hypothetical protein